MDTLIIPPHYLLLGIKPEPIATARKKVLISVLFLAISTTLMIYQDFDPLRHRLRTTWQKVKSAKKPGRKPINYRDL